MPKRQAHINLMKGNQFQRYYSDSKRLEWKAKYFQFSRFAKMLKQPEPVNINVFEKEVFDEINRVSRFFMNTLKTNAITELDHVYTDSSEEEDEDTPLLPSTLKHEQLHHYHRVGINEQLSRDGFKEAYVFLENIKEFCRLNYHAITFLCDCMKEGGLDSDRVRKAVEESDMTTNLLFVDSLIAQLELVYTKKFTNGNRKEMKRDLSKAPRFFTLNGFKLGVVIGFLIVMLIILYPLVVTSHNFTHLSHFADVFPIFRFLFSVNLLIWLWGGIVFFCIKNNIPYVSVLELDQSKTLSPSSLFKLAGTMSCCVCFAFYFYTSGVQKDLFSLDEAPAYFGLKFYYYPPIAFILFFIVLLLPFRFFHRSTRMWILLVILQCMGSPFTTVAFKHNFIADVLTSLSKPLIDLRYSICFVSTGMYNDIDNAYMCNSQSRVAAIMAMSPYVIRFFQCLRKFYDERHDKSHLVNAGKYMTSTIAVFLSFFASHSFFWFIFTLGAAIYCFFWDVRKDWGLLEENVRYALRKKLYFPFYVYYLVIFLDACGRFCWVVSLIPNAFGVDNEYIVLVFCLIEIFRRSVWAIFRICYAFDQKHD
ncbi:hypothetical protein PCE1_000301 [Barthelona sp. PCE]